MAGPGGRSVTLHDALELAIVLVLVAVAVGVSLGFRLGLESQLAVAVVRALVQLAAVAAVINFVLEHPPFAALFIVVMAAAAALTSGHRLKGIPSAAGIALAAISIATALALGILFGLGVFDFVPRFLVPIAGMLIGNSMNATSVAGALLRDEIESKTLEIETRLALGVGVREALAVHVRKAVTTSLIPLIDSTKNVGLILLPGGFVGMLLGGASPAQAAQVQAIILFMLLGAVAVAGMVTVVLVARAYVATGERIVIPVR
ncbi:MAG TPA: ABC transporter permease [Actinomycetota bacterium]|nr:ABC transporter permease [Actinomycetota bacterium]